MFITFVSRWMHMCLKRFSLSPKKNVGSLRRVLRRLKRILALTGERSLVSPEPQPGAVSG